MSQYLSCVLYLINKTISDVLVNSFAWLNTYVLADFTSDISYF